MGLEVKKSIELAANRSIDILENGLAYYNYEGNHFRVFSSKEKAINFVENHDDSLIIAEFDNDEDLDEFLEKYETKLRINTDLEPLFKDKNYVYCDANMDNFNALEEIGMEYARGHERCSDFENKFIEIHKDGGLRVVHSIWEENDFSSIKVKFQKENNQWNIKEVNNITQNEELEDAKKIFTDTSEYITSLCNKYDELKSDGVECDIYGSSQAGTYFLSKESLFKELKDFPTMTDPYSYQIADANGQSIFNKKIFDSQKENTLSNIVADFDNENLEDAKKLVEEHQQTLQPKVNLTT